MLDDTVFPGAAKGNGDEPHEQASGGNGKHAKRNEPADTELRESAPIGRAIIISKLARWSVIEGQP